MQCGLAAGVAGSSRTTLVGHERPFFAPIAAVISLGVSLGNRLRRVVELVVGVSLGVLVGDLLISEIGSGTWQITLVVTLAMARGGLANGGTLLVNQAGASAVLVATLLPPGEAGGLDRCVDALIGGAGRGAGGRRVPVRPGRPGAPRGPGAARRAGRGAARARRRACVSATPTLPGRALERARRTHR